MGDPEGFRGRVSNRGSSNSRGVQSDGAPETGRSLETDSGIRTPMGLGVPVAPSFLDLEEEKTVSYDAQLTPVVSLTALLVECEVESDSETGDGRMPRPVPPADGPRPRPSFHTVPVFPDDANAQSVSEPSVESNLHQIQNDTITNRLVPNEPRLELVEPRLELVEPRLELVEPRLEVVHHLRIGVSSFPPHGASAEQSRPQPSRRRSFFARLLFLAIVLMVLFVAASALSVAARLPWLDPRPHLMRALRFVMQQLPWNRIQKILHF